MNNNKEYTSWRQLGQGEETATLPVETPALPVAIVPPVLSTEKPAKPARSTKPANKKG
jgi:hypothetical protein